MTLHEIGIKYGTDKATAHEYLDFYESRIGEPKSIIEFGVLGGSSLEMWHERFPDAVVIGLDIEKKTPPDGCLFFKMDCTKENWITKINPSFDLIIDDAGHFTLDQVKAFELWWPLVAKGGMFIMEDIHTMYYREYNPTDFDLIAWLDKLPYKKDFFHRDTSVADSQTVIIYK